MVPAEFLAGPDIHRGAFSKGKALLRQAAARTHEALGAAIRAEMAAIRPTDAAGWFAHCG